MEYNNDGNITNHCLYQVAWCVKYLRNVLTDGADDRFKEVAKQVCEKHGIELLRMEVHLNYVSLLLKVNPKLGIHRAVKAIKYETAHSLRNEFPWVRSRIPTLWTNAYFICTLGEEDKEDVVHFVESQKGR